MAVKSYIFDHEKGFIPNVGKYIECDEYLVNLTKNIDVDCNIFYGTIASGDIFVTDRNMADKISTKFDALCTEMEGAAIGQAAYLNGIPFVILRAISDKADDSAEMDYPTFERKAAEHCAKLVEKFIVEL